MATQACPMSVDGSFGPLVVGCRQNFDFTLRFESIFFAICPSILFQLSTAVQIRWLLQKSRTTQSGALRSAKAALCLANLGIQVSLLVLWTIRFDGASDLTRPAAILAVIDAVLIGTLSTLHHVRSIKPSAVLQLYLLFTFLLDIARARTLQLQSASSPLANLFTAGVTAKCAILVAESVEKRALLMGTFRDVDLESTTSLLNRCVFWWLNTLISVGRTKVLGYDDLYALNAQLSSAALRLRFEDKLGSTEESRRKHWLVLDLLSGLKFQMALAIVPRALLIALKFCQPFLISRLLALLSSRDSDSYSKRSWGLILAFALVYFGIAVVHGRYWHQTFLIIAMIRGTLIGAISEKALALPYDEASSAVTLISADAERISSGIRNMHEAWANVIEVGIAVYLLQRQLGYICVVPLSVAAASSAGSLLMSKRVVGGQQAWMKVLQKRLNATTSVFSGLKGVKMLGLTAWAGKTLGTLRNQEITSSLLFRTVLVRSVIISEITSMLAPAAMLVTLSLVALTKDDTSILANTAFTSLAILALVGPPLATLIQTIPNLLSALACFERVQDFLGTPSIQRGRFFVGKASSDAGENSSITRSDGCEAIELSILDKSKLTALPRTLAEACNADVSWTQEGQTVLKDVSFVVRPSQLLVIAGPIGCGKSTLLRALLGESCVPRGVLNAELESVAFCDQIAWLREGSIRENVTAGLDYEPAWYNSVIEACELVADLASIAGGDAFRVGSKGLALSGGQRHRVAIARAVYSRKRLMLFDDVLGALDRKTARNVYTKVFGSQGLLRRLDVTAILVTHALHLPSASDEILLLSQDGSLSYSGPLTGLGPESGAQVQLCTHEPETALPVREDAQETTDEIVDTSKTVDRSIGNREVMQHSKQDKDSALYMMYANAIGKPFASAFVILLFLSAFFMNFSTLWLSWWSEANERQPNSRVAMYTSLYGVLGLLTLSTFAIACWLAVVVMIPRSGRVFHSMLLEAALDAPLHSFKDESLGEITNRFSQDIQIIDTQLPFASLNTFEAFTSFVVQMAIIGVTAHLAAVFIPLCIASVYVIQGLYLKTSRRLRLLDIEAKAPLLAYFIETLSGVSTIRAFGMGHQTMERFFELLDASQQPYYLLLCVQRWLGFVLDTLIAFLVVLIVVFAVKVGDSGSASATGAAIITVITCNQTLANLVESWTMMETCLGAVQRIKTFAKDLPSEHDDQSLSVPRESWPQQGLVEFKDYSCSYGNAGPSVLHGLSISIMPGEKVAICGRTGSGKSSAILALFQLIETRHGSLSIDGVDLAHVDRRTLRSRIASVPQEPLLFKEMTVQENLSLDVSVADSSAARALKAVGLWEPVMGADDLDRPISDLGLSQGQSQLFCVARALLRESALIVFDEATSSLDPKANQTFQSLIRAGLAGRTIISVEHNPRNVLDYDRVIVLHAGKVVEAGVPSQLAGVESAFQRLLAQSS